MKYIKDKVDTSVPKGEQYEPSKQVQKAKKPGVASTEKVVDNLL